MLEDIRQLFELMRKSGFEFGEFDIVRPYCAVPADISGIPIPNFLRDVYEHHIGRSTVIYTRDLSKAEHKAFGATIFGDYLYGGLSLFGSDELKDAKGRAEEWARETWISGDQTETANWMSAVPFLNIGNGDYLAFNCSGQVVYLCHDAESFVLADSLGDFWATWRQLYYIGPEWWVLGPFMHDNWVLDANSANIAIFQRAFEATLTAAKNH